MEQIISRLITATEYGIGLSIIMMIIIVIGNMISPRDNDKVIEIIWLYIKMLLVCWFWRWVLSGNLWF